MVARPRSREEARECTVEDKRPWHEGNEIVVVNLAGLKQMNWKFPRRDGQIVRTSFEANVTNRRQAAYQVELERMDQKIRNGSVGRRRPYLRKENRVEIKEKSARFEWNNWFWRHK
jgi:hypothetical protein